MIDYNIQNSRGSLNLVICISPGECGICCLFIEYILACPACFGGRGRLSFFVVPWSEYCLLPDSLCGANPAYLNA